MLWGAHVELAARFRASDAVRSKENVNRWQYARYPARDGTGSLGHGSPGHRVSDFGWVGSGHGSDPVLSFNMRVYRDVVSVPVTALLAYLFHLVPVLIFYYSRADCPCDVTFLDLTSFRLLTGLGRVGCSGHGLKIMTWFHLCVLLSSMSNFGVF